MKIKKVIGIYKITSPSGKIYIGQSCDIDKRWKYEYFKLHCKHQVKLYHSFLKHGVENHKFEVIHTLDVYDENELNALEIYYINKFNTFETEHGLNLTNGGSNGKLSEETKKKISEAHKGEKNPMYGKKGKDCPYFGKKDSDETRRKKSEARKGITAWNKGIPNSEEHRKKISDATKGKSKIRTLEHIKNNAIANTGKKRDGQALLNIIEAQRKRREQEVMIKQERLSMVF